MYDLRIERVGKGLSFRGTAEQKITITPAQPVKRYQEDNNTILFGLTDALPHLRRGNDSHPSGRYTGVRTFVDELDIKWRGPPATLWHVARYVNVIVKSAPRYSLASTNCYYFARVLFHIIGLRHYSFHRLISERADTLGTRSRVHDPSSISMLFRFLLEEEKSNGVLLHKYVQGWIAIFLAVMILGIILFGAVELGLHHPGLFYSLLGVGALWGLCLWALLVFMQNSALVARYQGEMRRKTERLVSVLGEQRSYDDYFCIFFPTFDRSDDDLELTNPRGKRGDYHLPFYLKRITETESLTTPFGREVEIVKWVERDGPREPVSQWPNVRIYLAQTSFSSADPKFLMLAGTVLQTTGISLFCSDVADL